MPLGGAGVDGHSHRAQAAVQQHLHDQSAEGVPNEDGRFIECAHEAVVVVGDLGDTQPRKCGRVAPHLLNFTRHAWPGRSEHPVAVRLVKAEKVFPTARGHPKPVDEHDGAGLGVGGDGTHGICNDPARPVCR